MADQVFTRETISLTNVKVSEQDKELSAEYNRTAWKALAVANRYLEFGPENARQSVVRSFLSNISKLSAIDSQGAISEQRQVILSTMARMTEIESSTTPISPSEIYSAVNPQALARELNDQDD